MESEKLIYWLTLVVLAASTVSGLATRHNGWSERLTASSMEMLAQASGAAKDYVEFAGLVLGSGEDARPAVIDIQNDVQNAVQNQLQARLACARRVLVKRQAQMVRLQGLKVQVRMLERPSRAMVWPSPDVTVDVPEMAEETF